MKYYAVFDTNVLVSSLLTKNRDSATVKVVDAVSDGVIAPLYNREILEEYEQVLHRAKFPFSENSIRNVINIIIQFGFEITSVLSYPEEKDMPDKGDIVFYRVVMEKRDDDAYLITGNSRHFPDRPFIVTPAEMVKIIKNNSEARDF